jgi:hypothetical protein
LTELGVDIQLEDAQRGIGKQLNQINFITEGVDRLSSTHVYTTAKPKMTKLVTRFRSSVSSRENYKEYLKR